MDKYIVEVIDNLSSANITNTAKKECYRALIQSAEVLGIDLDPSEVLGQDDLFDRVWSEEFDSILDEDEDAWNYVDDSDDD